MTSANSKRRCKGAGPLLNWQIRGRFLPVNHFAFWGDWHAFEEKTRLSLKRGHKMGGKMLSLKWGSFKNINCDVNNTFSWTRTGTPRSRDANRAHVTATEARLKAASRFFRMILFKEPVQTTDSVIILSQHVIASSHGQRHTCVAY